MPAGTGGRDRVVPPGPQVRGRREAGEVGGPGAGHGGQLVGAARAHLDQRPPVGGGHHPGRRRSNGAIVIEDGQDERLQDDGLGEGAVHDQDRRPGKVAVAFRVSPDIAAEGVGLQVAQGGLVGDPGLAQELKVGGAEPEALQGVQQPPGACHHAIAPAIGQVPGEDLEDGPLRCRAAVQRGPQHGQLVVVGQQGGTRAGLDASTAVARITGHAGSLRGPLEGRPGQPARRPEDPRRLPPGTLANRPAQGAGHRPAGREELVLRRNSGSTGMSSAIGWVSAAVRRIAQCEPTTGQNRRAGRVEDYDGGR